MCVWCVHDISCCANTVWPLMYAQIRLQWMHNLCILTLTPCYTASIFLITAVLYHCFFNVTPTCRMKAVLYHCFSIVMPTCRKKAVLYHCFFTVMLTCRMVADSAAQLVSLIHTFCCTAPNIYSCPVSLLCRMVADLAAQLVSLGPWKIVYDQLRVMNAAWFEQHAINTSGAVQLAGTGKLSITSFAAWNSVC